MRIRAISLTIFVFSLLSPEINAQQTPIKFGDVSKAELEMKVYDKDTSAAAVILSDYVFFIPRIPQFVRIIRIKILKKEGYNWANHVFPTSSKADINGFTSARCPPVDQLPGLNINYSFLSCYWEGRHCIPPLLISSEIS